MDTQDEIGTQEKYLGLYFKEVSDSQQAGGDIEEEEHTLLDEVEQATDFLQKAGLADLSKVYQQGKEITEHLVNDSVRQRLLTEKQAQTVRSRVRTLNKTLKSRQPRRKQRQDVRDVAWIRDTSTGSRSRSATPDSLDSIMHNHHEHDTSASDEERIPSLRVGDESDALRRKIEKWSPNTTGRPTSFKSYDKGDVAHLGSENVILKGYHQLNSEQGTLKKRVPRQRSGSDPTAESSDIVSPHLKHLQNSQDYICSNSNYHSIISSGPPSTDNNLDSLLSNEALSFEGLVLRQQDDNEPMSIMSVDIQNENRVSIDSLSDREYLALKPLLLVEVTAIFDQHKISVLRRKASNKRKRGNVFSVNLSTLVMRDMPEMPSDTSSMVPQIYRSVLHQLNVRCLQEDGILRVAGQKQKLELLCAEIEAKFYSNRNQVEQALKEATVHDLTGVLKKLLRDLPDPIFTMELFDMFYKTSVIPNKEDKMHALNLLVLMLPIEHRNTFRLLLQFFNNIVRNANSNRMSFHNVAMITAPSFFPPRLLSPKMRNTPASATDLSKPANREMLQKQIHDAAICCGIMDLILRAGDALWLVPSALAGQARESQRRRKAQEQAHALGAVALLSKPKKKMLRSKTQYESGPIISPRIYGRFHDIN